MDMKYLLNELRTFPPRIIVRENYAIKIENGRVVV